MRIQPGNATHEERPVPEPEQAHVSRGRSRASLRTSAHRRRGSSRRGRAGTARKFQLSGRTAATTLVMRPGFQIMSMRIRSSENAREAMCRTTPRCVRLIARSSALGPVSSGRLELLGLLHARPCTRQPVQLPDRSPRAHEDDRGDDPAVPDVVSTDGEREPDPEDDRSSAADSRGCVTDLRRGRHADRPLRQYRYRRTADDHDPEEDESRDERERAGARGARGSQSSKLTRP